MTVRFTTPRVSGEVPIPNVQITLKVGGDGVARVFFDETAVLSIYPDGRVALLEVPTELKCSLLLDHGVYLRIAK